MKKLCTIISLIMIIGCGGGGDDAAPPGVVPGIGAIPVIQNVVLTDENFNPKSEFAIGEIANFIVTATDPDKNMEELIIEEYFPSDSTGNPFYGPGVILMPSQSEVDMMYWLISGSTIDGPAGTWRLEFQIADSTGLESNVFTVFAVITSAEVAPVIKDAYFNSDLNAPPPVHPELTIGDDLNIILRVFDADRVIASRDEYGNNVPGDGPPEIIVRQYLLSSSEDNPYYGPESSFGGPIYYYSSYDIAYSVYMTENDVVGPAGEWRFEFEAVDVTGLKSDTFSQLVTILPEPCTYSISPTSNSFPSSGGAGSITVTSSSSDCSWTATESVDWIPITSGSSDTGDGTVTYSVSENTGTSSRTATITVDGEIHTVTQEGIPAPPASP